MKTLKDLTPEIEAKIPEYIARYTAGIFDGGRYNNFKFEDAEALIDWNYQTAGYKKPIVIVAENPLESQVFFNYIKANEKIFTPLIYMLYCLKNEIELPKIDSDSTQKLYSQLRSQLYSQLDSQLDSQLRSQLYSQLDSQLDSQLRSQLDEYNYDYLFTANVYSNSWLAWFGFMANELKIDAPINVLLNSWNGLYEKSGVYSAVFSELICVVSKYPKMVHRNDNNDMHNVSGAAVEWGKSSDVTNFYCYYINGRNMPKNIFETPFTKEDFIKEQNEDVKAGMYEIIESKGEGSMLIFLGAVEVDAQSLVHANGEVEELILYKTTETFEEEEDLNGNTNVPLAWLKMTCPSTGSVYLIPSDSSFNDCLSAAKYHRPEGVPVSVDYKWEQRN